MGCMNAKSDSEEISDFRVLVQDGVFLLQENVVWWKVWPPHWDEAGPLQLCWGS